MPLDEKYTFGSEIESGLAKQLTNMYSDIASNVNSKAAVAELDAAPTTDETQYPIGQIAVVRSQRQAYILVDKEGGQDFWAQIT